MIGTTLDHAVDGRVGVVAAYLDAFFDERIDRAASLGDDYGRLWSAARDAAAGGKRIRPALLLAASEAFARVGVPNASQAAAVPLAAAFELLHTAFLMHDDVIDHDLVRRGVPNLGGRFALDGEARGLSTERAKEYGEASAILAGDLLISAAFRLVAGFEAPADVRHRLVSIVDECVFLAAAGEHDDVRQATGAAPGENDILTMIEHKTASYSFSAPLQAGAVIGGASPEAIDRLGEIGRHMGVVFQLRDDVLGVFGTASVTGKSVLGDLREGKETLLIAYARGHTAWERVSASFGQPGLDEPDAGRLRAAIEASGARARVERLIEARRDDALRALTTPLLPASLRDELTLTVHDSVERER
ncbi:polyprenyl synthetase family protein [Agromyces humatus]|uniref:Polyprenyl synthetase family protein n=1 Tax=Agromyces humatus TaxID=279573 RepID=A0ABP4X0E9_9MICO|nr:polyprenyl synthetase family protein [Agromyces humatus]